jgi:hypothetical protein
VRSTVTAPANFFLTAKAGEAVDHDRLTQVGRAMKELGVKLIPAYSPQARGRSERGFGTWEGRLPQELRVRAISTLEAANRFLRDEYCSGSISASVWPPVNAALRLYHSDAKIWTGFFSAARARGAA